MLHILSGSTFSISDVIIGAAEYSARLFWSTRQSVSLVRDQEYIFRSLDWDAEFASADYPHDKPQEEIKLMLKQLELSIPNMLFRCDELWTE